jgi:hypothetical protein
VGRYHLGLPASAALMNLQELESETDESGTTHA